MFMFVFRPSLLERGWWLCRKCCVITAAGAGWMEAAVHVWSRTWHWPPVIWSQPALPAPAATRPPLPDSARWRFLFSQSQRSSAATEYHSQSHTSHPSPPHAALWAVRGRLVIVRGILQRNVRRKLDSSLQLLCCLLRIVKRHPSCCPWPCLHPITVLVPINTKPTLPLLVARAN